MTYSIGTPVYITTPLLYRGLGSAKPIPAVVVAHFAGGQLSVSVQRTTLHEAPRFTVSPEDLTHREVPGLETWYRRQRKRYSHA